MKSGNEIEVYVIIVVKISHFKLHIVFYFFFVNLTSRVEIFWLPVWSWFRKASLPFTKETCCKYNVFIVRYVQLKPELEWFKLHFTCCYGDTRAVQIPFGILEGRHHSRMSITRILAIRRDEN